MPILSFKLIYSLQYGVFYDVPPNLCQLIQFLLQNTGTLLDCLDYWIMHLLWGCQTWQIPWRMSSKSLSSLTLLRGVKSFKRNPFAQSRIRPPHAPGPAQDSFAIMGTACIYYKFIHSSETSLTSFFFRAEQFARQRGSFHVKIKHRQTCWICLPHSTRTFRTCSPMNPTISGSAQNDSRLATSIHWVLKCLW